MKRMLPVGLVLLSVLPCQAGFLEGWNWMRQQQLQDTQEESMRNEEQSRRKEERDRQELLRLERRRLEIEEERLRLERERERSREQKQEEEALPENKSFLNRQAKAALKQLGVPTSTMFLYSLQLANAALDRGLYPERGDRLRTSVQVLMFLMRPEDAQGYVERNADGEELDLYPKTPGRSPNPEELAAAILQEIEHKLSVRSGSGYPATIPRFLRDDEI